MVVDIKSERFIKRTCLQQDFFDMTMVTIMLDTKSSKSESFKCRGVYDECPSYNDEWQEVYDGCPSYDASPSYDGHSSNIACPFLFLQSECESLAPFCKEV